MDQSWALSPSVALRPEPFGALAYHFGNRRLVFLKRPELVAVVRGLGSADGDGSVRSALVAAGVPEESWPVYLSALEGLAESAMICRSAA
ncbi:mycofactocin biosynthesis chaperone MftB [Nocardioides hungaricus]